MLDFIPFGFLPINKPMGPTSHDMVGRLRRLLPRKKVKVGHTGTLDPFASGVMILAVGKATRFADDVHLLPKSYRAQIRLGVRTNTLDHTGEEDLALPVPSLHESRLREIEQAMLGEQDQMPPVFSAKRVGGKKSYELARKNQEVTLKTSRITIHSLELAIEDAQTLVCDVHCSTGTYIRSLARDIGEALGTCAHLTELVRTSVGSITLAQTMEPDNLTLDQVSRRLMPVSALLTQFPEVDLPSGALAMLAQGRPFQWDSRMPDQFLGVARGGEEVQAIFRCAYDTSQGQVVSKQLCYLKE